MAQPRRSARLAALSQPVEIDLTDPDGFSDGMSEDLTSFSDNVPLPPATSGFVCDGHFASSGPLSRCVLQCCSRHPLTVRDRLGLRVLPVRGLPRLQLSVPFLFGLPPLPALVLRSPRGGSCRRVHDLFLSSVLGHFLQCALLPSTHSLRMLGSVSPFLRRPLPFLHTGPRPRPF